MRIVRFNKLFTFVFLAVVVAVIGIVVLIIGKKDDRAKKIAVENATEIETDSARYDFMPCEMSKYIVDLSEALELDTDLCVAILLQENPEFNPKATHENSNGTMDIGLWQLNDRYLWSVFYGDYWKFPDVEFNPMNWKNSTYIALCHIKRLQDRHKTFDDVVMSYNCGSGAVMSHEIPDSTRKYLANVKNNYTLLKNMNR